MIDLQPVNQNVLLALDEQKEKKTSSGLFLPESAKSKNKTAAVVALGSIENAELTVGDVVLYKEFSGTEIEHDGKKYLLIPYADIMGKVVETESI